MPNRADGVGEGAAQARVRTPSSAAGATPWRWAEAVTPPALRKGELEHQRQLTTRFSPGAGPLPDGRDALSRERRNMAGMAEAEMHEPAHFGIEEARTEANGMSMVVFSGDLDKAIAAFIIANGAAAMDLPVSMFFTFWGLNILRREGPVALPAAKTSTEKMFGRMMPRGPRQLKLSQMNLAGFGTRMIKRRMSDKHVMDLPHLIQAARDQGVRLIACTMTMDLMGIRKEELLDGIDFGGVGTFVDSADRSRSTLFV